MLAPTASSQLYSIVIALRPEGVVATKDRDGREGDLCIDWIDYHSEKEVASDDTGLDAETDSWRYKAKGLGTVRKDENTEQQAPVRRQTQGTTELGSGVLHYLKHSQPLGLLESLEVKYNGIDLSGKKDPGTNREDTRGLAEEADKVIPEGQDGTLIAILAVPAYLGVVELADWLGAWNSRLEGLRMIRDASLSRTLVLLKFSEIQEANDFISIYTGKHFSSRSDRQEICHPIRIHHLLLHSIDPVDVVSSRLALLLRDIPQQSVHELPSCPVCLERLDSAVTGLATTPCSHISDCKCLSQWSETNCLACLYSQRSLKQIKMMKCGLCSNTEQHGLPWVCLVCGCTGCSRYQKGHARDHFLKSSHAYSMEIETQRVWDYINDSYVHRLIQNRSDGRLVELPSAKAVKRQDHTATPHLGRLHATVVAEGLGPTASDEKRMAQLEHISLEFSSLASIQLEEQKERHDAEVRDLHEQLRSSKQKLAEGEQWRKKYILVEDQRKALETKTVPELQKAQSQAESKTEKITSLARKLQDEMRAERAVSSGMLEKLKAMEIQLAKSQAETVAAKLEVTDLKDCVKDIAYTLEMRDKLAGTEAEGGDLVLPAKTGKVKRGKK